MDQQQGQRHNKLMEATVGGSAGGHAALKDHPGEVSTPPRMVIEAVVLSSPLLLIGRNKFSGSFDDSYFVWIHFLVLFSFILLKS